MVSTMMVRSKKINNNSEFVVIKNFILDFTGTYLEK